MTIADRIRSIVAALPESGSVTLPVAELRTWLEDDRSAVEVGTFVADLTAEDIATELERTPACVRAWCRQGKLPGAYRLQGREWRVPRATLRSFVEAHGTPAPVIRPRDAGVADLGAWRRERA